MRKFPYSNNKNKEIEEETFQRSSEQTIVTDDIITFNITVLMEKVFSLWEHV